MEPYPAFSVVSRGSGDRRDGVLLMEVSSHGAYVLHTRYPVFILVNQIS